MDNAQTVIAAFRPWEHGDSGPFFALVADDVRWEVTGSSAVSGVYESKQALATGAFGRLTEKLSGPLVAQLVDVIAVDDDVVLRFTSSAPTYSDLVYDQSYCFVMKMSGGRITEIVAYIDTAILDAVLGGKR